MKTKFNLLIVLLLVGVLLNKSSRADGFLKSLWNGITSTFRPVWGSYTVSGQNNSAPIALFKRTTFEKDEWN